MAMRENKTVDANQQSRLEEILHSAMRSLKVLFRWLFCASKDMNISASIFNCFDMVQNKLQRELYSYKDYFIVRSQRNISMTR